MEAMAAAHTLVREFLLFRGFSNTLRALEFDAAADKGHDFNVDRITELLFVTYPSQYQPENMMNLFKFLKERFFSRIDSRYAGIIAKLESSMKRNYIVRAVQSGRMDRVIAFFELLGEELLESGDDWEAWFAIPYMKNVAVESRFQVYFSKDWRQALIVSFRNFLMEVYSSIKLPALLELLERQKQQQRMETELIQLRAECERLRCSLVAEKTSSRRTSNHNTIEDNTKESPGQSEPASCLLRIADSSQSTAEVEDEDGSDSQLLPVSYPYGISLPSPSGNSVLANEMPSIETPSDSLLKETPHVKGRAFLSEESFRDGGPSEGASLAGEGRLFEEPKELAVQSVDRFSGHTSSISRCRFSASGANFASASVDGTVRIWTADETVPATRNATIYCGSEIMSLEWEMKSDRLLLVGTAEGSIKAWNVDAKRVACDLATAASSPRVVDIRCSPSDAVFVCSTATARGKVQGVEGHGYGTLTTWSMRTWKALNTLALGEDPPVITSLCFNHNGKILATTATDGLIRLFDMVSYLPITGWPAYDHCEAACVRFSHDQSSLLSLGRDGLVLEWSVHKQGQIIRSYDAARFSTSNGAGTLPREEMALDSSGTSLLLSCDSPQAPLFSMKTGEVSCAPRHEGSVTSVDWHPINPIFLTASTDHSVHVTRLAPSHAHA